MKSTVSSQVVEIQVERKGEELESDGGSLVEETESVNTCFEEQSIEGENEIEKKSGGSRVKDYVMDWIGKEVGEERPKGETGTAGKSKSKKKLEWWEPLDEEKGIAVLKKEKRRPAREWWKEEYSQELSKKMKKKKNKQSDDDWWEREDEALYGDAKRSNNKIKSRSRKGDSWFSGELRRVRWNSFDSGSGEIQIPKSGDISSTPSMRGTVFYVAPEYGHNGEDVSEKCDVYSFGVLLLVIVSGRRPLQVTGSVPLSEFRRANLLSWARHCARNGKLLELVDQSLQSSWDKEQALLCINIALLCLLKSPTRRPSMKHVVGMLSGELEPPQLPVEYSSSSSSKSQSRFKNQKEDRRVHGIN